MLGYIQKIGIHWNCVTYTTNKDLFIDPVIVSRCPADDFFIGEPQGNLFLGGFNAV